MQRIHDERIPMMKFPARPALVALLAASGFLGSAAATEPDAPTLPNAAAPSDGVLIDADEMAAIHKARQRCRDAGGPKDQQACMNQAQIDYYRARDAAGAGKSESRDGEEPRSGSDSDSDRETQAL